jgi:hypothetical protein
MPGENFGVNCLTCGQNEVKTNPSAFFETEGIVLAPPNLGYFTYTPKSTR